MRFHNLGSSVLGETGDSRACLLLGLLLSMFLATFFWRGFSLSQYREPYRATVKRVDDGDTVVLEGGTRVRYLGINTPEVTHRDQPGEPYGKEAKTFNRSLVLAQRIRLEFGEERHDRYGRLLAFVFLEDGTFVNAELVRQGYAHLIRPQPHLPYWEKLLRLQRQAMRAKRGIWSLAAVDPENCYLGNKSSWVFHRPDCPFGRKTTHRNRVLFSDRQRALYQGFSPCRRCRP